MLAKKYKQNENMKSSFESIQVNSDESIFSKNRFTQPIKHATLDYIESSRNSNCRINI